MDMHGAEKDVEIAVGVLSALAVLLSAVEAWSWSKRLKFELLKEGIRLVISNTTNYLMFYFKLLNK